MEEAETEETEVGATFLISLGGKLDDDLWTVLGQDPPSGANPAFPVANLYSSRDSWRCFHVTDGTIPALKLARRDFPVCNISKASILW